MGCLCTRVDKSIKEDNKISQTYSWDKRREQNINPQDYIIDSLIDKEEVRVAGSVDGQQIIIQNCQQSNIYILDYINTVTIDDCKDCRIILGPVQGSVFLRNCKDSICVSACGQFRTRDCRNLKVFLLCATQPIIENSTHILFSTYQLNYKDIQLHCIKSGLNVLNKEWDIIHDFTPIEGESNWSFADMFVADLIPAASTEGQEVLNSVGHSWKTVIINEVVNRIEPEFQMETTL